MTMKKLMKINTLIIPCLLLTACGGADEPATSKAQSSNVVVADENYTPTKPFEASKDAAPIPEGAPALGTDIADVVKADSKAAAQPNEAEAAYQDMMWDDLVPEGFQPSKILARYQARIQEAKEGSPEERELYKQVMGEFNNAGANQALSGKKIRIPGYVAPLDTSGEMVGDFLLVPYYGSCIHSPPPPAHQTVMVTPGAGTSVALEDTYLPVWVTGEITVEKVDTKLATAGYQIKNAKVELYSAPIK